MNSNRDNEWLKEFGQNLKKVREKKGFSLRGLADQADVDFSQIHRIEKGETNPSIGIIKAIADVMNIKVAKLFDF
jgi:transcriptional regulator with XRE-family HTH domain